ncbi:MAG: hypothetical protein LBG57_05850 [Treponema sp.]|jgi:hypothetical protein|nr:hypothetical protein [Treponema sp.]
MKLFSYVLRFDDGAAPNPFWGYCTLTICKPVIRRTAKKGDWVIGTGSKKGFKKGERRDFQDHLVYAMKISEVVPLEKYDRWCRKNAPDKIPGMKSADFRKRAGDCIYTFSSAAEPVMRESVHSGISSERDLSGKNALISDCFYYFGENALLLPDELLEIVKRNQGHKKILDEVLINNFVLWLERKKQKNKIYGDPQMPVSPSAVKRRACAKICAEDDSYDDEIIVRRSKPVCQEE